MNNLSSLSPVSSLTAPVNSAPSGKVQNVKFDWLQDLLQGGISNSMQSAIAPTLTDGAPSLVRILEVQSQIHAQVLRAELISKALESANSAMRRLSQNAA